MIFVFSNATSQNTERIKIELTQQLYNKLPLKQFIYCDSCKLPLTGYLVKKKGLYYYKCRTKGCSCNKSAKALHTTFSEDLKTYQLDPKYKDILKEVITYTYDNITKELRTRNKSIKKTITELSTKIDSIEERHALGELDNTIYKKFKDKYETQKDELQSKIENPSLSSSNLELAIDKALTSVSYTHLTLPTILLV
mgnify:CR=1 FL=1